jgi:hypothetical protein
MGGRLYEQLQIDWCEAVLDVLAARARSDAKSAPPEPRTDAAPG